MYPLIFHFFINVLLSHYHTMVYCVESVWLYWQGIIVRLRNKSLFQELLFMVQVKELVYTHELSLILLVTGLDVCDFVIIFVICV